MKLNTYSLRKTGVTALILSTFFMSACRYNSGFPTPPSVNGGTIVVGKADFSRYIALGNSLTAGFADGGLYRETQMNSYPAIIAQQMQRAGGGTFLQPLFGLSEANGSGYLKLAGINPDGTPNLTNVTANLAVRGTQVVAGRTVTLYNKYNGNINNFGIPGIKLIDINSSAYGNLNGYFERLLPNNSPNNTATYLDFATQKPFTFFSNWLGNNDALSFATSGGTEALTDKALFETIYTDLLNRLTARGAKGVVATIPDVTSIAYFNAITMSSVMAAAQKINPAAKIYINARTTAGAYAVREAKTTDLLILEFPLKQLGTGAQPYGLTPAAPIESKYVLDENETALAKDYIASYNASIKKLATAKGLAVFDAYTFLNTLKNGISVNGVTLNANYITGGVFSLDGIHLTPRGYALLANQFIKAINAQYGTALSQVNVSDYRTIMQ